MDTYSDVQLSDYMPT